LKTNGSARLTLGCGDKGGEAFKPICSRLKENEGSSHTGVTKPSLTRHADYFILGHFNTPIEYGSTPDTSAVQIRCHCS
jgi:hypothetical protein